MPLSPWHTVVPREMTAKQMDSADWAAYIRHEEAVFAEVRARVTDQLPASARIDGNRYYAEAPIYPAAFETDWNRSYILEPDVPPRGAVVLLHGLTDSPYSLRHAATLYRDCGFVAVGIRLPGHGTVPGGLTRIRWKSWMAATRLAVREAERRIGPEAPLHLVGYSNGGTLAMKYTLDALESAAHGDQATLRRPDRVVLLSPMIGLTRFARYAGLASAPAILPPFVKTAWKSILPEYNPFKYNSFPINGARQSYRISTALQEQIRRLYDDGTLLNLPPVLTFQSVMDNTVSTPAIFYYLYEHIPQNGSELVVFDVNRAAELTPIMNPAARVTLQKILPPPPLQYRLTVVTNMVRDDLPQPEAQAVTFVPGATRAYARNLGTRYPREIFSLSHVAVPFPIDDPLYGIAPPPGSASTFGVNLGTLSARGELGTLSVNLDALYRITSNPFFDYVAERIAAGIDDPAPRPDVLPHIRREPDPALREREEERLFLDVPHGGEELLP